ncbi:hypothetical protein QW180_07055 [Vibrio sinaloensis]|nr:hypothetical protein [Vibrio sinaloensis]
MARKKKSESEYLHFFGHLATSVLKPKLLTINQFIAGLTTMAVLDNSRYSYLIDFFGPTLMALSQSKSSL